MKGKIPQVKYYRKNISVEEYIQYEIVYIQFKP